MKAEDTLLSGTRDSGIKIPLFPKEVPGVAVAAVAPGLLQLWESLGYSRGKGWAELSEFQDISVRDI